MKNNIVVMGLVVIIVAAVAFFAGKGFQNARTGNQGQNRNRFGITGGRQIIGEILNSDDKSITIKLTDGSTKIVLLTNTTSIIEATQAAKTDLKVGGKVGVFGATNTDGSITAQNIQLRTGTPNP